MFAMSGICILQGYFQYLPAIHRVLPTLCRETTEFLSPQRDSLRKKYGVQNLTSVGYMHIRRGDYLTAPQGLHWVQPIHYYMDAWSRCREVSRWFILSDDVAWCKEQPFFRQFEIVDEPDELSGLALMSLCHGAAILANSTYSWWGAMLGASQAGAPVVYPSRWYEDRQPTLFPAAWIRI